MYQMTEQNTIANMLGTHVKYVASGLHNEHGKDTDSMCFWVYVPVAVDKEQQCRTYKFVPCIYILLGHHLIIT